MVGDIGKDFRIFSIVKCCFVGIVWLFFFEYFVVVIIYMRFVIEWIYVLWMEWDGGYKFFILILKVIVIY